MPDLKKFLNAQSPFQRMLYMMILVFVVFACLFFTIPVLMGNGFPFVMLLMPLSMFAAFGGFIFWMFRRSSAAYDHWWNGLTDAEKTDIEQDFRGACQISYYLMAGQRYAFIRNAGRVVPFDQIDGFDIRYSYHSRVYLHIELKNAPKVVVGFDTRSAARQMEDDLMNYGIQMNSKQKSI